MFLEISFVLAALFVAYLVWDKFWAAKKRKERGRSVRVLLSEKVGNDKVFVGTYKGFEESDEKLGVYLLIKGVKKSISVVSNSDYFADKEFGKCLMVCKYAEDDYRPEGRIRGEGWFRETTFTPEQYLETETVEVPNEEGVVSNETRFVKDKKGNFVSIDKNDEVELDEEENPLPLTKLVPFVEPVSVTQDAREAMRFERDFSKRMQEKRAESGGFWDKYGQFIMVAGVLIIMFMACAYSNNKMADTVGLALEKFGEESDKIVRAAQSPGFAEGLLQRWEQKKAEESAPPK